MALQDTGLISPLGRLPATSVCTIQTGKRPSCGAQLPRSAPRSSPSGEPFQLWDPGVHTPCTGFVSHLGNSRPCNSGYAMPGALLFNCSKIYIIQYIIQCIILINSVACGTFTMWCKHHHYLFPEHFHHPKRKPIPISIPPHSLIPQPLATANPHCLSLQIFLFLIFHINRIIQKVLGFFHSG